VNDGNRDASEAWNLCMSSLRPTLSDGTWFTTFRNIHPLELDEASLVVAVGSSLVRERLLNRHLGELRAALADQGLADHQLIIEVDPDLDEIARGEPDAADDLASLTSDWTPTDSIPMVATIVDAERDGPDGDLHDGIDPRYTFDKFVTGASNRFAHAAAQAVAEKPGGSYNPLFIHGGAGLGKTHLLQAIVQYLHSNYPKHRALYVSSEVFLNDFIQAIRNNEQVDFKKRYREIDVLLLDDIQFMENKEGLQEEFFHTFNSLHGAGRQIVLSSDRPPKSIATLEDRLRSRFEWGLICDIQPPDVETRVAILRKKVEYHAAEVPGEILEFIATNIQDNIRELEGALTRVCAYASLTKQALDMDLARRVLADIVTDTTPRPITAPDILQATAERYGFEIDQLTGRRRHRDLVQARQVAMYVCRQLTPLSFPSIAREFGGRDHTTIIHAVERVEQLMKERQEVYDQVTALLTELKART
jgi:chromosomal replication initiator protein